MRGGSNAGGLNTFNLQPSTFNPSVPAADRTDDRAADIGACISSETAPLRRVLVHTPGA
jgi:hypothetical protein